MAQPITDKHDTQVLSFKDFVDSVFTELNSPANEWYADLREYGYYYKPTYWENALIPLAVRLYELAQNDDAIYWWLIREMSLVDLCKASKEDIRKRDVFDVLLQLKPEHGRIILDNSVPKHAEELQKALDNDDLETFRSLLPLIADDNTIYNIGRVLMRVEEVRDIFERTIHYTKGESLGRMFVLFREFYRYFAGEYKYNNRYCDGLAKNVFLALYQTQYREDKVDFCDVAIEIGELWVKNLALAYFLNKNHMPKSVSDVLYDTLQSQSAYVLHDLKEELTFCDNEVHSEVLKKSVGGWLDIEKYSATFRVFDQEWRKTLPPFSCRCHNGRRRVRILAQKDGNVERRNAQDNCVPYIDSKNAIPKEVLETLKAQEANKNVEIQEPVAVSNYDPEPALKGKGHGVKDKNKELVLKPMPFPNTLDIAPATPKLFLEVLHSKLVSGGYLADDSVNDLIFILGGVEVDSNGTHHAVDWKKDIRATLQAFCSAFYGMEHLPPRKKPWAKLSNLFTLAGKPILKLSEDANEVYGKDNELWMKERIQSAIDDAKKKALESQQEESRLLGFVLAWQ